MKIVVSILIFIVLTQPSLTQYAGSFTRLGFGARGIGMGNALTAISNGEVGAYYNPALAAFSEQRTASATVGILSLDRYLNFLSYTQSVQPTAGLSIGIINAGVKKIDGRDGDGIHTEDYSTFENQFFFAFANKVDEQISIGVALKLYYSKLFEKVSSTTVGFDIGGYYQATPEFSLGAAIKDIGSKYKWDTTPMYGQDGRQTTDKFPSLLKIGAAYLLPIPSSVVTVEYENSSAKTSLIRFGAEYSFTDNFTVRGGLDRWDMSDNATGAKPSFGFTLKNSFNDWTPILNYAFTIEPFSPHGMHIISLSAAF